MAAPVRRWIGTARGVIDCTLLSFRLRGFETELCEDGAGDNLLPQTEDSQKRWEVRISRVPELEERQKSFAPALRFYGRILQFQAGISSRFAGVLDPELPLRAQIDVAEVVSAMPSLLSLATKHATDLLREAAHQWQASGEQSWREILNSAINSERPPSASADDFFTRACLQPLAENLQLQLTESTYTGSHLCPACGGLPQMAVLRPEGDAAGRWLLCSFCLREWAFRRLICPWCHEEDKEKLPRFSSDDLPSVHVEACDTCRRYLKAIDMTVDGFAAPLVDEAAFAVLDVWAADRGYTKLVPNLIGF
jgi:FdhE protein